MSLGRVTLLLVTLLVAVRGQKPVFENPGDILQSIKSSGLVDQFEDDLKKMLFDESERRSKVEQQTERPEFDAFQFIKTYVAENDLKVSEKLMLYLMDLNTGEFLSAKSIPWQQFLHAFNGFRVMIKISSICVILD